jgi:hypothetical protein
MSNYYEKYRFSESAQRDDDGYGRPSNPETSAYFATRSRELSQEYDHGGCRFVLGGLPPSWLTG